jgi:DNA-binding CsgD family transcriptional regulator
LRGNFLRVYDCGVWNYLLYFFYVACICAGAIVITLAFMLAVRNKAVILRCYIIFIISFFCLMAFLTVNYFFRLTEVPAAAVISKVFYALFMVDLNFLVFFVPFFSVWIVGLPWKAGANATFISLTAAYFIVTMLFVFFIPNNVFLYILLVGIFTGMLIFSISVIIRHRERIKSSQIKTLCLGFVILSVVFCPIIIYDACAAYLRNAQSIHSTYGIWVFPIYYLWFNILSLVYLIGYFVHLPNEAGPALSKDKLQRFKVTEREAEIIELLRQGLAYKDISDRLCISVNTVNNHVANIYSKVGAKNRIDLLRILF